jgi:hypothetical protein
VYMHMHGNFSCVCPLSIYVSLRASEFENNLRKIIMEET